MRQKPDDVGVRRPTSPQVIPEGVNHPDVNAFFTCLKGKPRDQMTTEIQAYMDANPQVRDELKVVRQAAADFRDRCNAPFARHADGLEVVQRDVALRQPRFELSKQRWIGRTSNVS